MPTALPTAQATAAAALTVSFPDLPGYTASTAPPDLHEHPAREHHLYRACDGVNPGGILVALLRLDLLRMPGERRGDQRSGAARLRRR